MPYRTEPPGGRRSALEEMTESQGREADLDLIHVSVASIAGAYTVGNQAFFRYIVRLGELGLPLEWQDQEALDILAAIPHAFDPEREVPHVSGRGWRVVPAQNELDWPTLEATPERLHSAFERARGIHGRTRRAFTSARATSPRSRTNSTKSTAS